MTGSQARSHGGDTLLKLGLPCLLVASTLNGFSMDVRGFGREITLRPDLIVLVAILPVLLRAGLQGRFRVRVTLFDWIVCGFLLTNLAASILFARQGSVSLQGALLLGAYVAMYFVTRQIVANRGEWLSTACNWLLGIGVAQAAYSVVALVLFCLGVFIGGLQLGHLTETSIATKGTFWEANLLGSYLGFIAVFLMVRVLLKPAGQRADIYLLGLFLTGLALPLSLTRAAGLAGGLAAAVLVAIVLIYRREIPGWGRAAAKIAVVLGCVGLTTVTVMNELVSSRSGYPDLLIERWLPASWIPAPEATRDLHGVSPTPQATIGSGGTAVSEIATGVMTQASQSSADGRVDAWMLGMQLWRSRPLLGHGTLAGSGVIKEGWWYSSLLQALYDTGLAGFCLLLSIHIAAVVAPVRVWLVNRGTAASVNLLALGLGNAVLVCTSQFSNSFFVGLPWVFLGLTMGAVDAFPKTTSPNALR